MIQSYYKYILGFILFTVLATVGLQGYWNYKNYQSNEFQLKKEIQLMFDQSVSDYFEMVSKEDMIGFFSEGDEVSIVDFMEMIRIDTVLKVKNDEAVFAEPIEAPEFDSLKSRVTPIEVNFKEIDSTREISKYADSTLDKKKQKNAVISEFSGVKIDSQGVKVIRGQKALNALGDLSVFKNRMTISITRDTIDYHRIDTIFKSRLQKANVPLQYAMQHFKADTLFETFPKEKVKYQQTLKAEVYTLKPDESLKMSFDLPKSILFYRMSVELGLSLLLALAVLGCLLFLLKIINQQKRIDEIKNDFISNMTHEFKTPIATISSALEGMTHFNPNNDPVKNEKYLNVSNQQLQKLTQMVEKILEMASLKADQLQLNLASHNVIELLENVVSKFQPQTDKTIHFETSTDLVFANVDGFYMEQVFSNLIDNAIKYGGNNISIEVKTTKTHLQIDIADNGEGIPKAAQTQIFEQFYRVPKGNIHDVKGFGIGLFFAKTITEKCNGTLQLLPELQTTFRITLPQIK
jgi:two-component system phosphate regulon sensor histidine kinase PhoR